MSGGLARLPGASGAWKAALNQLGSEAACWELSTESSECPGSAQGGICAAHTSAQDAVIRPATVMLAHSLVEGCVTHAASSTGSA